MRLNQKGFSAIEILIVIIVITLVGFVGWRVYDSNKDEGSSSATQQDDQTNEQQDEVEQTQVNQKNEEPVDTIPDGWTEYKDAKTGVSFLHPLAWSVEDKSTEDFGLSLSVTSDDFVETPNSVYGGTDMGVFVRIGFQDKDGDEEIDGILNGTDVLSENISEISDELDINGDRGVSYGIGYEGPPAFLTLVDASEGYYYIQYTDAPYSDGSTNIKSAPFYDDYMMIVDSFKTSQ